MKKAAKTIKLYDVGGLVILVVLLGIPFGTILDYIWNLLVLVVALPRLPGDARARIGWKRRLAYSFFITLLGIIIDWAYFEVTWDTHFGRPAVWAPGMSQVLQLAWLLLPIVMIWLVNAAMSYALLRLERRQAIILGAVMGVFTAPWLLPTIPYALGWVV